MNTPEKMVNGKLEFKSNVLKRLLSMDKASVPTPKSKHTTSSVILEAEIRASFDRIEARSKAISKEMKSGKSLDRIVARMCKVDQQEQAIEANV